MVQRERPDTTVQQRPRLGVVVASTRPGRVGPSVARWFVDVAERHGRFDVDLIDLAEANLPLLDEPNHPRLRRYTREHTVAWSERVEAVDAFVFVVPEYNFGMSASLKNAIDYLFWEWQYKPAGFVSYGGVSGGTRGVQMAKDVMTTVKMMPLPEAVHIPFVAQMLDESGAMRANEGLEGAGTLMLDEVARWEEALRPLRRPAAVPAPAIP